MIDFKQVKADTVGRWSGIFAALGISVGDGRHCPCPICSASEKESDRFRFDDKEGRGTWYCNHCGAGDGFKLVQEILGIEFREALEEIAKIVGSVEVGQIQKEKAITPDILNKIFRGSRPATKTDIVGRYLNHRGIDVITPVLRFHPGCYEPEKKRDTSAMLAVFTLPNNEAVTIHRTYLDGHGDKAAIKQPKKLMPALKKMSGGAIRLFDPVDGMISVSEGIETALAIRQEMNIPVWSTVSSTLMAKFEPPKGITFVNIFADNDKNFAGQKAAYELANRLVIQNKIDVKVFVPERIGTDFQDQFCEER